MVSDAMKLLFPVHACIKKYSKTLICKNHVLLNNMNFTPHFSVLSTIELGRGRPDNIMTYLE